MRTNAKPSDLLRFVDSSLNCNTLTPNDLYPCHLIPSCLSVSPSVSHTFNVPSSAHAHTPPCSCFLPDLFAQKNCPNSAPELLSQQLLTACDLQHEVSPVPVKLECETLFPYKKNFKMAENLQKFRLDDTNAMRTLEVNPLRVIPTASPDVCLNINGFTPHSTTAQSPLANRGVQSATVHFLRGPWILSSRTELQRGKQSHLRFAVNGCKSQPIILLLTAREVTAILLPQRRFRLMNVNGEHK